MAFSSASETVGMFLSCTTSSRRESCFSRCRRPAFLACLAWAATLLLVWIVPPAHQSSMPNLRHDYMDPEGFQWRLAPLSKDDHDTSAHSGAIHLNPTLDIFVKINY